MKIKRVIQRRPWKTSVEPYKSIIRRQIFIVIGALHIESPTNLNRHCKIILNQLLSIQVDNRLIIDNFRAFYYRALCYEKLGNIQEEEKDYLQALKLNQNSVNTIYHLSLLK